MLRMKCFASESYYPDDNIPSSILNQPATPDFYGSFIIAEKFYCGFYSNQLCIRGFMNIPKFVS